VREFAFEHNMERPSKQHLFERHNVMPCAKQDVTTSNNEFALHNRGRFNSIILAQLLLVMLQYQNLLHRRS
jgi:hypothetical protein